MIERAKGRDLTRLAESTFGLRRAKFETDRSLRRRCSTVFSALTWARPPAPAISWWGRLLRWLRLA